MMRNTMEIIRSLRVNPWGRPDKFLLDQAERDLQEIVDLQDEVELLRAAITEARTLLGSKHPSIGSIDAILWDALGRPDPSNC